MPLRLLLRCCRCVSNQKVTPLSHATQNAQSPTRSLLLDIQENAQEEIQILTEEIQRKKSDDISEQEMQHYLQKIHETQVLMMNVKNMIKQQQPPPIPPLNKKHRRVISYSWTY